jgi:hypothetical protein
MKVKNLVWRVCGGCFPTRVCLVSRGVTCPTECVVCSEDGEDSVHALFMGSHAI